MYVARIKEVLTKLLLRTAIVRSHRKFNATTAQRIVNRGSPASSVRLWNPDNGRPRGVSALWVQRQYVKSYRNRMLFGPTTVKRPVGRFSSSLNFTSP